MERVQNKYKPKYSPKLIARCQRVMEKHAGRKINPEEAERVLEQFASLGLLMGQAMQILIDKKQSYGKNNKRSL